ncbi:bifunctional diguanylate cyclase/phosphodiesterase [Halomonas salinarum]|uniref:bifunctional diguanylate cyclase/phosphodiesterase n=1 Tax=Halomonas salinarum TaxID=1158993 RepID=UPI0014397163|nr:EAL domain-containing protein [Halomonas salinarum]
MHTQQQTKPKLGLTWRVIAMSSLLLLGLTTVFTMVGRDNLLRQFDESRNIQLQRQAREIRQALSQSTDSLRQLAALNASFTPELGKALKQADQAVITDAFRHKWPTMQLEAGIDEFQVLDNTGRPLAQWGTSQPGHQLPITAWGNQVVASDTPLTTLRCLASCRQYALVPVLVDGQSVGAVLISRSLADVTRQARKVSGSDIALLITGQYTRQKQDGTRRVSAWNGRLATLTNQEETLPLIHQAAYKSTLENLQETPVRLKHDDKHIEISTVTLNDDSDQGANGHFLLMSDITSQIDAINRDTGIILATGLFGWLAAEVMLLAILWKPMARVRRLAGVLPALAEGGFAKTRQVIPKPKRRLSDEIDLLDATALDLASQLETLQSEVSSRDELLNARVEELARERDFIESLLDTAHVLILTQDDQGRISLVNQYCQETLDKPYEVILGQRFEALFHETDSISPDGSNRQPEERLLCGRNDEERTIVWYHARLADSGDRAMHTISVGIDITDRKAAESRLTWLANRDSLTSLYNRRAFQERVEDALASDSAGAVLFMDLDQFKDVNELSGHPAGDSLLLLVAQSIQDTINDRGIVARLGGDEFAVLLEHADEYEAIDIAQALEKNLDNTSLLLPDGRRHRASVSTGIACYPLHGHTPDELMANADVAMYKAKESSLRSWHILSTLDEERNELHQRVYWIERIRHALQNDEFVLMAQPIADLSDGSIKHYEILLRLIGDNGELITPGVFIPIAERSGQIVQMDRWVLHHSLNTLRNLQEDGITLSVNLSGHSLHDLGLNDFLASELERSGANPSNLILEVTETAAITDFSTARGVLQGMRDLGCKTALDDFGVGFSSFHYLGQLPVDFIKIDGSFIKGLEKSKDNQLIVKAITDIAQGFGKLIIAEFVDSQETIKILDKNGVRFGQGYYLGKPERISTIPTNATTG